ncbi:GNAT family N-acetyltransferase [soil metagenome]|jgi:GNAT superfamily N-acetyltransferase
MGRYSKAEPLNGTHHLDQFDCGIDAETFWLRRHAWQAEGQTSRTYVVRRISDDVVVGYYAIASGSVMPEAATPRMMKGAGHYDQPVIILTRMGVDVSEQGRGLGRGLVVDALKRISAISEQVGVRALLIHAEDDTARDFYMRLANFEASPTDPFHLLLLMKDLRRALQPR